MSDSPAAILYDSAGIAMAVADGSAIPANTKAVLIAGKEGSNSRFILFDSSGRPIVVGAGTAGSPSGGVLTIQGVSSGTVVAVKETKSSSTSCANVSAAASDTQLLASNSNRLWASVYNDSTAILYLKLGTGASTTSYTIALNRYDYFEAPPQYTGAINGYWSSATGTARITEI